MSQMGRFVSLNAVAETLTGDIGGAINPVANNIDVLGGTNIGTVGTIGTITINLDNTITLTTVNATTFDTNVAAAAVTLSGTTLLADGSDADIDINITAKGAGQVIIDDLQLTTDLAVTEGGTGVSTMLDHGLLVGAGVAAVTSLDVGGTGVILTGVAGADPAWTTATYPATAAIGTILIASGANVITTLAPDTAGYVLTDGGAGVAPSWQANADMAWNTEAGATVAMAVNNAYINQAAGLTTFTLPAAAAVGSLITVCGQGAGGFKIAQNAAQEIQVGDSVSTNGIGGYIASTNQYDVVSLVCRETDSTWQAISFIGILDVA